MKNLFKKIILDFQKNEIPEFQKRDLEIFLHTKKIITLTGARRTGKTYLFYQIITKLFQQGVSSENIIFINFEDERLEITKKDLDLILKAYLEYYPQKDLKDVYFFLDEIQNVVGWEKFVRRVYDDFSKNIFITGSSAKLLSTEIATSLRGRSINFEVYPLSFREFLKFKKIDTKDIFSTKNSALIRNEFQKYITIGGFPEIIFFDKKIKLKTLQNYSRVMLYRDIVERYNIKNISALKFFIKKNISNFAKPQSVLKTYNEIRSTGIRVGKDSVYDFRDYTESAYYLFFLKPYSESINKQESGFRKTYVIDTGLAKAVSFSASENFGRLLENMVFLELKRREKDIFYFSEKGECDFVIRKGTKIVEAIQVTQYLDEQNKKREIDGLVEALRKFKLKSGLILTEDQEDEFQKDGKKIKVIPIWKWVLEK